MREHRCWRVSMFPHLRDAQLPPRGSMKGEWGKVLGDLLRLQKKAQKEAK